MEIDLGEDFLALANHTTWPIFFHETMPAVREFLAANEAPVSFEQIYAGLGEHIKEAPLAWLLGGFLFGVWFVFRNTWRELDEDAIRRFAA